MAEPSRTRRRNIVLLGGLCVLSSLIQARARAQAQAPPPAAEPPRVAVAPQSRPVGTPPPGTVEQVTVTSLRQRTNLQKTPVAITSISSTALDKSNITTLAGLNGLVPGLTITKTAGFENLVDIRGVGSATPENALVTQPGVSLFVDGVYIANTISLDQTLFDLDRIEVLRGPQGTLYGQSSTGGVINLVTNQPVLGQYSGHADFGIGNDDLFRERAAVNLPISDQVAVRLSFQKYDHSGFGSSVDIPNYQLDDAHDTSGKVAILYKPSETFSATFTAQWYGADQNGAEQKNIRDPDPDPRQVSQDYPSRFDLETSLYHLNLEWTLPWATLRSVTAYQNLTNKQSEDSSRLSYAILHSYDDIAAWNTSMQNYSEELDIQPHLGRRLDGIAGLFLTKQRSEQFVAEFEGKDADPDLAIAPDIETSPPLNLAYGNVTTVNRESVAPFVQATYHLTPSLRLTGGIRYNYDHYNDFNFTFASTGSSKANTLYQTNRTTGNINLQYDLTPRNLLYGSVTEGYKPGGVNGNEESRVVGLTFLPEDITSFEIGSKNRLLQDRIRLNVAAFFYDYRDLQYIETDPVPFAYGIANVPNTHIWGGEAEASYLVLHGRLRFNGQLTLEDGRMIGDYKAIDSVTTSQVYASSPACAFGGQYYNPGCWAAVIAAAKSVNGNKPPGLANVQAALNAEYSMAVPWGHLTSRVEYVYRGSEYARVFNSGTLDHLPTYGIVNLDFRYTPDRARWVVELALSNLTDIAGVNSRFTDPYGTGQTSEEFIAPFQVIGTLAYSF